MRGALASNRLPTRPVIGAQLVVGQGGGLDEAGQRLDEVDVDQLAAAAVHVAVVEGHHHGVGGRQGGHTVGQHERRQGRWPVGLAGQVGEAAHGLGQGAEAGAVALRSAPAVPAHVEHHQLRMALVHRLVVDPPAGHGARPVVDDQHVAHLEQPVEEVLPVGLTEIEGHAALVAAHALPHQADLALAVAPGAQGVADPGLLDLDDVGAELAHGRGHQRTGGQGGRVHHPDTVRAAPAASGMGHQLGAGQPEGVAQGVAGVAVAEHPAALELGNDQPDDVLVGAGRVGGGHGEAVARLGLDPLLHLVGHLGSGADEARALEQGGPVAGQVGQGHGLPPDVLLQVLHQAPDARDRPDELVGDRGVEGQPGEVVVHELRQQRQRRLGIDQGVEEEVLALLGVGMGLTHDGVHHGQHLHRVRVPPGGGDGVLLVLVVRTGDLEAGVAGEDQLGPAGGEVAAPARRAGLEQHRTALGDLGTVSGPRALNHSPS